jgi:hypothetical protein
MPPPERDTSQAYKLFFEALKHLTTLDSGGIVILAAIAAKGPLHGAGGLVIFCMISLLISLAACLLGMFSVGSIFEQQWGRLAVHACVGIAFVAFIVAMLSLGLLVARAAVAAL